MENINKVIYTIAKENPYAGITKAREIATKEICKQVGLKKEELAQLIVKIINKIASRKRKNEPVTPLRKQLQSLVIQKIKIEFANEYPYRTSQTSWAGGVTFNANFAAKNAKSFIDASSSVEWSSNGKWKGTRSYHNLYLNPSENFIVIGGLFTFVPKNSNQETAPAPATWYVQGRGFELNKKAGFLYKDFHIGAATAEEAKKVVEKKLAVAAKAKAKADQAKADKDQEVLTAKSVMSQFAFCESGVRQFCQDNNIDFNSSITFKELRNAIVANRKVNCDKYVNFINRMGINLNCK